MNFTGNVINSNKIKLGNDMSIFLFVILKSYQVNLQTGEIVTQKLDLDYRKKISSHHSATHLLHETLRQKLGSHVAQKGSLSYRSKIKI